MSRRFWIVCLMLALLPLRGWAAASMTVPAALTDASVQIEQMVAATDAAVPSCHEAVGDESAPADHTCNLCDLCHSAAADLADTTLPQMPLPEVAPRIAAAHDTGRHAVGGLERPPRTFLA
jgi:cytochrome c2